MWKCSYLDNWPEGNMTANFHIDLKIFLHIHARQCELSFCNKFFFDASWMFKNFWNSPPRPINVMHPFWLNNFWSFRTSSPSNLSGFFAWWNFGGNEHYTNDLRNIIMFAYKCYIVIQLCLGRKRMFFWCWINIKYQVARKMKVKL